MRLKTLVGCAEHQNGAGYGDFNDRRPAKRALALPALSDLPSPHRRAGACTRSRHGDRGPRLAGVTFAVITERS